MGNVSGVDVVAVSALALSVILLVATVVLWGKVRSLRKKYLAMLSGAGVANMEDVMIDIQRRIQDLQEASERSDQAVRAVTARIGKMKGNTAIMRYNAFNEKGQGSDLSFSIAFMDDAMDGAVLTGIYGREESYMYGKPIAGGQSKYSLTPEEKEAIRQAMEHGK